MIRTTASQPSGARATVIGTRTKFPFISHAYEGLKMFSKTLGFYQDIKPYLPETYLDKYRYKPHKRVAGYIGKAVYKSKNATSYNKFRKTRGCHQPAGSDNKYGIHSSKSSHCS